MNALKRTRPSWLLAAAGLLCGGCVGFGSTEESRFYLLPPLGAEAAPADRNDSLCVQLAVVELPGHLGGPEIVTRSRGTRLELADFDRWAEPLDENFADVLATNLSVLLGSDRVFRRSWERPGPVDYSVTLAVHRFDEDRGTVHLSTSWKLSREALDDALVTRRSVHSRAVDSDSYRAIVRAMGAALADLSREIADEIAARAGSS